MVTRKQILFFLDTNKYYLEEKFNVSKIGIFGSFAKGTEDENSDIDIIVEFKDGTENLFEIKNAMKEFIGNYLNIKVDLCREKYIKSIFREKILKDAYFI